MCADRLDVARIEGIGLLAPQGVSHADFILIDLGRFRIELRGNRPLFVDCVPIFIPLLIGFQLGRGCFHGLQLLAKLDDLCTDFGGLGGIVVRAIELAVQLRHPGMDQGSFPGDTLGIVAGASGRVRESQDLTHFYRRFPPRAFGCHRQRTGDGIGREEQVLAVVFLGDLLIEVECEIAVRLHGNLFRRTFGPGDDRLVFTGFHRAGVVCHGHDSCKHE